MDRRTESRRGSGSLGVTESTSLKCSLLHAGLHLSRVSDVLQSRHNLVCHGKSASLLSVSTGPLEQAGPVCVTEAASESVRAGRTCLCHRPPSHQEYARADSTLHVTESTSLYPVSTGAGKTCMCQTVHATPKSPLEQAGPA